MNLEEYIQKIVYGLVIIESKDADWVKAHKKEVRDQATKQIMQAIEERIPQKFGKYDPGLMSTEKNEGYNAAIDDLETNLRSK